MGDISGVVPPQLTNNALIGVTVIADGSGQLAVVLVTFAKITEYLDTL